MNITLVSPFRTLINLNSDVAFAHSQELSDVLEKALQLTADSIDVSFEKRISAEALAGLSLARYANLESNLLTWFSEPLAKIKLLEPSVLKIQKLVRKSLKIDVPDVIQIKEIEVSVFDNTVAIIKADTVFSLESSQDFIKNPAEFNQFLSDYTSHIIEHIHVLIVTPFLKNLIKGSGSKEKWSHNVSVIRTANEFVVFDDLAKQKYPELDTDKTAMLWVHRVLDISTVEKGFEQRFKMLSKNASLEKGQSFCTVWGGSFIDGEKCKSEFYETLLILEYFYSLLDMYSRSQRRLLRDISQPRAVGSLSIVSEKYDRLENAISELINETADYYNSLLDVSVDIFDSIWNSFRAPKLMQNLEARSVMLKARIERISQVKQRRQIMFINFVLISFGGLQIINLALNLFWYAKVSPADDFYGVIDVMQLISPDLTFNVGFSLIILTACIWAYFVRRGK